jgi:hypothetical protein
MSTKSTSAQKRIVQELDFSPKIAKRATWESFEFTVIASGLVEVTNASYGASKDSHTYTVEVADHRGDPSPVNCDCPADTHQEGACKHRVALATIGGPTVLQAAVAFGEGGLEPSWRTQEEDPDLKADGGTTVEACPNGDPSCNGPESDQLSCFPCYESMEGQ